MGIGQIGLPAQCDQVGANRPNEDRLTLEKGTLLTSGQGEPARSHLPP